MSEPISTIQIILTSSVVAGVVSAFVATWTNQRKISIENITQERKAWRDKVREKALEVHNSLVERNDKLLKKLRVEFMLILNPEESENNPDLKIIECIKLPNEGDEISCSYEFSKRVAYLLKHDWERSKLESSSLFCRLKCVNKLCKIMFKEPKRETSDKNC